MASTRADSATTRVVRIAARSRSARRPSLAGRVGAVRSAPGARWLAVRIVGEGVVRGRIMGFSGVVGGSWGAGPAACRPLDRPRLGGCFAVYVGGGVGVGIAGEHAGVAAEHHVA